MFTLDISKTKAFSIHLFVSLIIFIVIAGLIYFAWYPGYLFWTDGGIQGIAIIAGVDVILGPLLTLLIFKPGKKGLKNDVVTIASIQLAALLAGVYIVYSQKTIGVFFTDRAFYTMDHRMYGISPTSKEALERISSKALKEVYVLDPDEEKVKSSLTEDFTNEGFDIFNPALFRPIQDHLSDIKSKGLKLEEFSDLYPDLLEWANTMNLDTDSARVYPYYAKYSLSNALLIFDTNKGQVIDFWPRNINYSFKREN